jgi:hypothetical protein
VSGGSSMIVRRFGHPILRCPDGLCVCSLSAASNDSHIIVFACICLCSMAARPPATAKSRDILSSAQLYFLSTSIYSSSSEAMRRSCFRATKSSSDSRCKVTSSLQRPSVILRPSRLDGESIFIASLCSLRQHDAVVFLDVVSRVDMHASQYYLILLLR